MSDESSAGGFAPLIMVDFSQWPLQIETGECEPQAAFIEK
jgi:hypothetical protein